MSGSATTMRNTTLGVALATACLFATTPARAQDPGLGGGLAAPPVLLVGVIIPEGRDPMAITEDPKTHEQSLHPLGAQIGDVRLTRILKDRVVLSSGDVAIEVRLAGPPPPPPSRPAPSRVPPGRGRVPAPR